MAEELAQRGWQVVAVARTVGGLEALDDRVRARDSAGALTLAPMDVSDDDAMRHLCRSIYDRWGGLDFWAHTAIHATPLSPAPSVDAKDLDKAIAINLRAASLLITMVEPLLREKAGTAMFFDDPLPGHKFSAAYGATKAGQMAIARAWQAETIRIGPRVQIVSPAPMPTALRARFYPGEDRDALAPIAQEAHRLLDLAGLPG